MHARLKARRSGRRTCSEGAPTTKLLRTVSGEGCTCKAPSVWVEPMSRLPTISAVLAKIKDRPVSG